MRTAILVGLLYVAYCINPQTFDRLQSSIADLLLIGFVSWWAFALDLIDVYYKFKNK